MPEYSSQWKHSGGALWTVFQRGSDEEQIMFAGGRRREVSNTGLRLCFKLPIRPRVQLCAAPPPLTRGEAVWHFLWVAMPHQLISSLLSLLISSVYPWSLCLSGPPHLLASHLPSLLCFIFLFLSLLWGERRSGVGGKKKKRSTLCCYHGNCI